MTILPAIVTLILMAFILMRLSGPLAMEGEGEDQEDSLLDLYEGNTFSPRACTSLQLRRCRLAFPFQAFPWASCSFIAEKIACLIRKGCTEEGGLDRWLQFEKRMCKNSPAELPEAVKQQMALTAESKASRHDNVLWTPLLLPLAVALASA